METPQSLVQSNAQPHPDETKTTVAFQGEAGGTDQEVKGWCSWCFENAPVQKIQHSTVARDLFKCMNCFNSVHRCASPGCKNGFARKYSSGSELFCAVHSKQISAWGSTVPPQKGNCSWCLKETDHERLEKHRIKRDVFRCLSCNSKTSRCKKCNSFARGTDQLCFKCNGSIKSWENASAEAIKREGWCSWCFQKGPHSLEHHTYIGRNIYKCDVCSLRTLPCVKCSTGMTRGGIAWDDKLCAACFGETGKGWEEFNSKLQSILHKRDIERVKEDMSRQSKYRTKAAKQGLIRPFLLLVAMPAIFRNHVASFLGFTIFTYKHFGDSHAEAWKLLGSKYVGIQGRCKSAFQKMNIFFNYSWFEIMLKVSELAFREDLTKEIPRNVNIMEACRNSKDPFIPKFEERVLQLVNEFVVSQLTAEQREESKREDASKAAMAGAIQTIISDKTGITNQDVLRYGWKVTNQVFNLKSQAETIILHQSSTILGMMGIHTAALTSSVTGMVPVALLGASAMLATPLFVLGLVGLGFTGVRMVFGSSEGRLIVPMITILNQRLLLAVEGIRLEDYY